MVENILIFFKKVIPMPVFLFFQPFYHLSLAFLAAFFYGFPSRKLKIIGVTGTNGKTTVVHLLSHILRESGFRTALISSLDFKILNETKKNDLKMTMPGRFFIQKFLRKCVKNKVEYVILEVTSEGIRQFRHRFIKFGSVILTNVTPEHIESHGSFEKYLEAKISFFHSLSRDAVAVINKDDHFWGKFFEATRGESAFYSKEKIIWRGKNFNIRDLSVREEGISFLLDGAVFHSPLLGEFNFYNILAAVSAAISEDVRFEHIRKSVGSFRGIPGRLEFVRKKPFSVVVDYAHTPDSLRKVYETLRELITSNQLLQARRLICVLGAAGGGRDKWKRPEFGKIAGEFCDEIILTNEDPYDENPAEIIEQIAQGFRQPSTANHQPSTVRKILDRREAIREALKLAHGGDTVIITGKGAEPWIMGPKGAKTAWDDREVVKAELEFSE